MKNVIQIVCVAAVVAALGSIASAVTLYYSDRNSAGNYQISRSAGDFSTSQILAPTGPLPNGMNLDLHRGKVYWVERVNGVICRANLDGSNVETVIADAGSVRSVNIDPLSGGLLWTSQSPPGFFRADYDGGNQTTIYSGLLPGAAVTDNVANALYFVNTTGDQGQTGAYSLERLSLDDLSRTVLISGEIQVTGFDIDFSAGKMYWADLGVNGVDDTTIEQANLDGSNVETLLSGLADVVIALKLDLAGGQLYWTSRDDGTIKRAQLDGSSVQTVISGLDNPHALAIPEPATLSLLALGGLAVLRRRSPGRRRLIRRRKRRGPK